MSQDFDLAKFKRDLKKWSDKTAPDGIDIVVRKVLLEIDARLMNRSPVGQPSEWAPQSLPAPSGYVGGRFKGNWQYTVGSAPSDELDIIDPSGEIGKARREPDIKTSKLESVHYFTNNVPYAERLENGWSGQAPQGIINRIELEFPSIWEQAKR